MIHLVAMDLDGTLLKSDKSISDTTVRAIRDAHSQGVAFAVATGRMYRTSQPVVSGLLDEMPIIAYNGALIRFSNSGLTLLSMPIAGRGGERVVRRMWEWGIVFQGYLGDDELWVPKVAPATAEYSAKYGAPINILDNIEEFVNREAFKYLVLDDEERILVVKKAIDAVLDSGLRTMLSSPGMIEIVRSDVSKGRALAHLASSMGISMDNVMAIGDSGNDIDMLCAAGVGVAMANASDDVKAQADYVVGTNDDDGVAEALESLVLS
ncbi:MAG: Cof-type HAD-IIB family hydrolase [Firmicutes bacterium]|nr:Cof-type HAD-IIB family hydrolase [Bacillota bacterium]MDD4791947.1 Cof-type HAD-IIB family hydrolase [Bacillota bacterium]